MIGENNVAYGKNPSKARHLLLASVVRFILSFHTAIAANGSRGQVAQPQENFPFFTLIYVWKQYFQLLIVNSELLITL